MTYGRGTVRQEIAVERHDDAGTTEVEEGLDRRTEREPCSRRRAARIQRRVTVPAHLRKPRAQSRDLARERGRGYSSGQNSKAPATRAAEARGAPEPYRVEILPRGDALAGEDGSGAIGIPQL